MPGIEYGGVQVINEDNMKDFVEANDTTIAQELSDIIDRNLPPLYRKDYAKLKMGVHVNKTKKEELRNIIKEILDNHKYEMNDV